MTDERALPDSDDVACIDEVELISDYLDGELPEADARRLERHLETCPGCTEYLEQMRAVAGGLGGLGGESLAPGVRDALIAAFRASRESGP